MKKILVSTAVAVSLLLTIPLAIARTEVISEPSGDSASVSNHSQESANANIAPISSYRDPLDECFDVPVSEVAACRAESQTLVPSYPSQLDECFDVSISELASCRNASQKSTP